ncbi:MAG: HDOD domain-containing protein [Verrucomicrobia bacterium]|jgi:HD-like signal output (HDOD) protein|nr:HDOD domain-containing protein [Verrucomicrobiota bacterium]
MTLSRENIIALGNKLAPALATFSRLRALLLEPETTLDEITKLIRLDPALTFHVVRLSNSVLFGVREPTQNLDLAVGRVGLGELVRLVALAAAKNVCQRDLPTYRLAASRLWENAVATAAAAELLAERAERDPGLAYSAGLLRTIGRVILDGASTGHVYPGEAEWPVVAEWERRTFGISSAEVTVELLSYWRFPSEITEAIEGHFEPLANADGSNVAGCVLNLACGVVARFGLDLPGEMGDWECSPAKLTLADVSEADLNECAERARRHFNLLCASVA